MSNAPKIYNYHSSTGEYIGDSLADADPLDKGNWLVPANASLDAPPPAQEGFAIIRSESGWEHVEDHRGPIFNTENGEMTVLGDLGAIPDGFTSKERPGPHYAWKSGGWRRDLAAEIASMKSAAIAKRTALQSEIGPLMAPLQDAVDLGDATDEEANLLNDMKRYRVALNRIEQQPGFPEVINWPKLPVVEE